MDRLEVTLEPGALILMCSDGLPGAVGGDDLFDRLRQARRSGTPPEDLADELINLALERGARDNVTALVIRQEGDVPPRGSGPGARVRLPPGLREMVVPFLIGTALGFVLRGFTGF
jgi:hypothetical protein